MKKILVIEDDAMIQELIVEFLNSEGYLVDSACDGLEGFKKFESENYDLVLLDVMMPNLDGFSVCKMIRKKSDVPIIFLTALNEEYDQIKGFDLDCDDYITKPFSFSLLLKRVEAVLRRGSSSNKENTLSFEKIVMNLDTYKVMCDKKEVELTLTEFNLLKFLIQRYPGVVTRDILLDNVWGYDYYVEARTVDVHIKNLRKKIGYEYIKTVKGVGYTLDKSEY